MSLRVLIAGGGTGGHVLPALAIKQQIVLKVPGAHVAFAGTRSGMEYGFLRNQGEELHTLWISGLSRRRILINLLLPLKLTVSALQCLSLIARFRPQVVVGTGGYVMGPVIWTAQLLGIPTLLQEQNSRPGLTTRKLANRARVVCVGYEATAERLPKAKCVVTGNPLRASFQALSRAEAIGRWKLDSQRKTVLFVGGSAGARTINDAVAGALPELLHSHNVIWQTGRTGVPNTFDLSRFSSAVDAGQLRILPFIDDMSNAYAAADLAVCRAGAMTLAELAVTGLPAILVPYPYATDDHQTANALSVAAGGAAVVIKDSELTPETLLRAIGDSLVESTLRERAEAMRRLARPHAAEEIAELVIKLASKT